MKKLLVIFFPVYILDTPNLNFTALIKVYPVLMSIGSLFSLDLGAFISCLFIPNIINYFCAG